MTIIRKYFVGMGQAVADRTVNRPGENWGDVAERVALGSHLLHPESGDKGALQRHISQASILLSGRHLQHGDENQPNRPGEVFTNCSTAILRAPTFRMLLNGSGVGTCYDDDLQVVDLTKMPFVVPVIRHDHPDVVAGRINGFMDERAARHFYGDHQIDVFVVPDTREGWAAAIEQIELYAYMEKTDVVLLLEFSIVREYGAAIKGMQNRPSSGPGPLMEAIARVARLRGMDMPKWKQALIADHLLAECVLVGGARRSARIAVKYWKDKTVLDFIDAKRPIEYLDKSIEEIRAIGKRDSFLWSANNSVAVDAEFWEMGPWATKVFQAVTAAQFGDGTGEPGFLNVDKLEGNEEGLQNYLKVPFIQGTSPDYEILQRDVTKRILQHPYKFIVNPCLPGDTIVETSEGPKTVKELVNKPFITADGYKSTGFWSMGRKTLYRVATNKGPIRATAKHRFWVKKPDGYEDWFSIEEIRPNDFIARADNEWARVLRKREDVKEEVFDCTVETTHAFMANGFLTHNCGEIVLSIMSGVCVIGDLVPFHTRNDKDLEEATRLITRALIRTNLMDQMYGEEVRRTNRIGVSLTGIHEWAWKRFGLSFRELLDEKASHRFWDTLKWMADTVEAVADAYSAKLGVTPPHTLRTIKPAGTTSKLFGLTEGAHLPALREYLRWVQFRSDDPLVKKYEKKGYPSRVLTTYAGTTIIGFPTQPTICQLEGLDVVTAGEATPEEQFQWLRLLEKYWIGASRGNQVSYTLKYDPSLLDLGSYQKLIQDNVPTIRAVSVLPDVELSYEYEPEQEITRAEYDALMETIGRRMHEDVDRVHVECEGGSCPIDFVKEGQ